MKLLTSPILYTSTYSWDNRAFAGKSCCGNNSSYRVWWFCADRFREYFGVPETATKVWLEFYTSPAAGRYKAVMSEYNMAYLDGRYVTVMPRVVKMIVRRLKRTTCYVECHYEE